MDAQQIQHVAAVVGEVLAFASLCLTALLSAVGTLRNLASHANFISVQERGKIGAFLDRFALVCEKGKKGLVWVLSLPGFASQAKDAPAPDLKPLVVLPLLLALSVSGCATVGMPANATPQQKLTADAMVIGVMKADIESQCPKMAPIAGLISKAVAVAMTPADIINDIAEAAAAIPDLEQDYQAVACAVKVILADYQKYFKAQPAASPAAKAAAKKIVLLEGALKLLDDGGVSEMQCASPSSR